MSRLLSVLKKTISDFIEDDCLSSGAAIAYYTIFSLPPLLVMVVYVASAIGFTPDQVNALMKKQVGLPVQRELYAANQGDSAQAGNSQEGDQAANQKEAQQSGASLQRSLGPIVKTLGVIVLLFTATGVFAQFQYALNRTWNVELDPEHSGVVDFIKKRVLSFAMILIIIFLLLVSLVLTIFIEEIITYLQGAAVDFFAQGVAMLLNNLAAVAIATLLFAAMFKFMPDAKIEWRGVWVGAAATAVLFVLGKVAIGWYVQSSAVGSAWGSAATSMIAILVWVYYNSLLVLLGAEFTQEWAAQFGTGVEPVEGAVRVIRHTERVKT